MAKDQKTKFKKIDSALSAPRVTELKFYHIPSETEVAFNAYITDFKDNYSSEWENSQAYGRMDPIGTFKSTVRNISLSWVVPSISAREASLNMQKAQDLISMLYPSYARIKCTNHAALVASPLLKVLFSNFICDTAHEVDFG